MTDLIAMPRRIMAWPGQFGPMTGHWGANTYYDDAAAPYIRADCIEDELLSLATDDEADAIRAAMRRRRADRNGK